MNSKIIKIFIFLISVVLVFSIIFTTQACSKLDIEIFGKKFGGETKAEGSEIEDTGTVNEQSISDIEDDSEDPGNVSDQEIIGSDSQKIKTSSNTSTETADIAELRLYFIQAMEYFKDGSYLIAEYYLNKIKDSYPVLQDHIFYYMAKSLFYQEKYDQAEEYYLKLIKNYPDSVWAETASLEYADMFYTREDYITAENEYEHFRTAFPHSSYVPYCLFQLAICQEMNGKKDMAFENYKEIWLKYPLNEYSETVWENLIRLPAEDSSIEPFVPTANQIYNRGEIYFNIYYYYSALDEFNRILQGDYLDNLPPELHSKTLFKKGMCYYKLGDYNQSKDYLLLSYEKSPSSSLADDSLYYMGRALTNLNLDADAISYYQKLVELFPTSNYSDDALYRIGRIYFFKEDFQNAASYFQRVFDQYPNGDMLSNALWELGWIKYKAADYNSARTAFSNYASSYKGTQLEEKGLFWQAKCCQKLGENDKAADLYKKIVNLNSYSYYTFASGKMLAEMNEEVQIEEINTQLNPENPQIASVIPDIYSILEEDSYIETGEINHIDRAIELLKLEFFNSASLEIEAGSNEIEENLARILQIATLYMKSNDYANSFRIIYENFYKLKSGLNEPYADYLYYLYYPYGYKELVKKYSSQYNLDPLFTLAVIRQESLFEPDARSPADAQGLMQIWPPTGEYIANKMGIPNYNINLLLDPDINIRMGTYYLRQQLDNFGQNEYEYCLGAYNKGPGRMSDWISKRGNMDIGEFIESIPIPEAREYIKIVMGNYYFYQMLYD